MKNIISIILSLFILSTPTLLSQSDLDQAAKASITILSQMADSGIIKDFNSKNIANSSLAFGIEERIVNFDKLISSTGNFKNISESENKFHYPVINNKSVISTITMNSKTSKAVSFNDRFLTNELNNLPRKVKENEFKELKLYRIPNLNAYVYVDREGNAYSSYDGRSLKEIRSVNELFKELKEEAIEYNKKYGNLIRDNKLLH